MIALLLALQAANPQAASPQAVSPQAASPAPLRVLPEHRDGDERAAAPSQVAAPAALALAGWDADGDGRTARAEMVAGVSRSFAAIDAGGTGRLRFLAFADWSRRFLGDATALPTPFECDANGDDQVSLPELQAAMAAIFDRLDADRDGYLSRAELLSVRAGGGRDERGRGRPRR